MKNGNCPQNLSLDIEKVLNSCLLIEKIYFIEKALKCRQSLEKALNVLSHHAIVMWQDVYCIMIHYTLHSI